MKRPSTFQPPQPQLQPQRLPVPCPSSAVTQKKEEQDKTNRWNKLPRTGNDVHNNNVSQSKHKQSELYDLLDDDDDGEDNSAATMHAFKQQQQQQQNNAFQTATAKYANDLRKEGKAPTTTRPNAVANTSGLRRLHTNNNNNSNNNNNGPGGKFVPPFVKKALQAQGKAPENNKNNNRGGGGGGSEELPDGPLTLRTYQLLNINPNDPLPEELSRLDPQFIEQVCNEIIDSGGAVTWEDIAGQEAAKKLIQEVVVWPMLNPHIFKGARAPPKGILLFGPPGTGKTLLGKAIASNIKAAFFSISASSLTSKWIGEGEKMVRALFAVAGWMAPSVIFIDEIDSLLSARKSDGEHEASRRLKTEMLIQMEGCDPASSERRVLLIGATNRPEELDEAARRRMPKQLYIPLPCGVARREMILRQLGPTSNGGVAATLREEDLDKIVEKTKGYSGSDMKNLIQEACQGPVRDAVRAAGAGVAALSESDLRPVTVRDFAVAARAQRASVEAAEVVRYEEYNAKHGAKVVDDAHGLGGKANNGGGGGGGGGGGDDEDWDW